MVQQERITRKDIPDLGRAFFEKDYIEAKDIETMADNVAFHIYEACVAVPVEERNEKTNVVIEGLSINSIMDLVYYNHDRVILRERRQSGRIEGKSVRMSYSDSEDDEDYTCSDYVDISEIMGFLDMLREAVIERLKSKVKIKNVDFDLVRQHFKEPEDKEKKGKRQIRKVEELHGGRIFKRYRSEFILRCVEERRVALEQLAEALKGEPCDYVASPDIILDKEGTDMLIEKRRMTTLGDFLKAEYRRVPIHRLKQALEILLDNMRGAEYLSKKGLILMDICTDNCGIHEETGKGFLFDYDGMFGKGKKIRGRLRHGHHKSPWINLKEHEELTEAEMVFQFGISVIEIFQDLNLSTYNQKFEKVHYLIRGMANDQKDEVLTIDQAIEKMEKVIEELEN